MPKERLNMAVRTRIRVLSKAIRQNLKYVRAATAAHFAVQNICWCLTDSLHLTRKSFSKTLDEKYELSAFLTVKDEARFLPEWIAYYRLLGVQHFYVYDNGSSDGTAELLSPLVRKGLLTLLDWPDRPCMPGAFNHFTDHYAQESRWVMKFDPDEFLVPKSDQSLLQLLRESEAFPAVCFNWRYFGSSGHRTYPNDLVISSFVKAASSRDFHVKPIYQPRQFGRYRNAHNFFYRGGRLARTPDGRLIFGSFVSARKPSSFELNHYVYRSTEDFERKARTGFLDAKSERLNYRMLSMIEKEFSRHNEIEIRFPIEIITQVKSMMKEIGF